MRGTFRRLGLLSSFGLALAAFAPAAHAAGSVTTLPATNVTTNSANIWGKIDTGGETASYRFDYGTSLPYQQHTAWQALTPSSKPTFVEGSIFRLRPNTTYHFRVTAIFVGIGSHYGEEADGQDLTFTTKPIGRLALLGRRLRVTGGRTSVRLRCRSHVPCKGRFSISTHGPAGKAGAAASVVCVDRSLRVGPHKTRTFRPKLRRACRSLLRRKPNHVLRARFVASTRTGQLGVNRAIKLIG